MSVLKKNVNIFYIVIKNIDEFSVLCIQIYSIAYAYMGYERVFVYVSMGKTINQKVNLCKSVCVCVRMLCIVFNTCGISKV